MKWVLWLKNIFLHSKDTLSPFELLASRKRMGYCPWSIFNSQNHLKVPAEPMEPFQIQTPRADE